MAGIRCSSCGERIPYAGKVCPWCHADKTKAKLRDKANTIGAAFAILGMAVGGVMFGWPGVLGGMVFGVICMGVALAAYGVSSNPDKDLEDDDDMPRRRRKR